MNNKQRTRTEVAVACGDPLTADQREFLDQDANTATTAQDFEILNLRLGQLGSQEGVAPESVRMHVAEIPMSVSPRRVPTRKLGYAFATLLAVAIVSGPFVSVIQSRVTQKQSGESIWKTKLKGKVILGNMGVPGSKSRFPFVLSETLTGMKSIPHGENPGKNPPKEGSRGELTPERLYSMVKDQLAEFVDPNIPSETGSALLPFVTLEGCKLAYRQGATVSAEIQTEGGFTWTKYSFSNEKANRLVRVAVYEKSAPFIHEICYLKRKDANSPYSVIQRTFLSVHDQNQFKPKNKGGLD